MRRQMLTNVDLRVSMLRQMLTRADLRVCMCWRQRLPTKLTSGLAFVSSVSTNANKVDERVSMC